MQGSERGWVHGPGRAWSQGGYGTRGCMVLGGGAWSRGVHGPGRYASYWNAFLFGFVFTISPYYVWGTFNLNPINDWAIKAKRQCQHWCVLECYSKIGQVIQVKKHISGGLSTSQRPSFSTTYRNTFWLNKSDTILIYRVLNMVYWYTLLKYCDAYRSSSTLLPLTIEEEVNNFTTLANVCLTVCFSQDNLLNVGPGLITGSVLFGLLGNKGFAVTICWSFCFSYKSMCWCLKCYFK